MSRSVDRLARCQGKHKLKYNGYRWVGLMTFGCVNCYRVFYVDPAHYLQLMTGKATW